MSSKSQSKKVVILETVTHYMTAFVVVLKGLDKIDLGKTGAGITFLLIGVVIALGTLFHHKAAKLLKHFKAYVLALEAVVMAIVGYMYAQDGKQFIQYVCYFASAMFITALVVYIKRVKSEVHVS